MTIGGVSWLPPLVEFIHGDWDRYCDEVYSIFENDFVINQPIFRYQQVKHQHFPEDEDGKHYCFWHLVQSGGSSEEDRQPDFRRMERIRWPRPVIENEADSSVLVWENDRRGKTNICLFFTQEDYLVVLGKRNNYVLLLSAYPVEYRKRRENLLKEYRQFHGLP